MRLAAVFPFFRLPRLCQCYECFLAVYRCDENARTVLVLISVGILRHRKRPFTFVASGPIQGQGPQIEGNIQATDQSAIALDRWREHCFYELRTRGNREAWRKSLYIGNSRTYVGCECLALFCWQIVSMENPLLRNLVTIGH